MAGDIVRWKKSRMTSAFGWRIDPIHNGEGRMGLLAYSHFFEDYGIYINIDKDGSWSTGSYEEAFGNITDGVFYPKKSGKEGTFQKAVDHIINDLGVTALTYIMEEVNA